MPFQRHHLKSINHKLQIQLIYYDTIQKFLLQLFHTLI